MNFHETKYGHIFYEVQLPRLIKALERIADDLSKSASSMTGGVTVDPNFLHDLYFGEYEPSVFTEQSAEQRALDRRVSAAEQALQQIFAGIPAAAAAFETYQLTVSERNGATVEQAFESPSRSRNTLRQTSMWSYRTGPPMENLAPMKSRSPIWWTLGGNSMMT